MKKAQRLDQNRSERVGHAGLDSPGQVRLLIGSCCPLLPDYEVIRIVRIDEWLDQLGTRPGPGVGVRLAKIMGMTDSHAPALKVKRE